MKEKICSRLDTSMKSRPAQVAPKGLLNPTDRAPAQLDRGEQMENAWGRGRGKGELGSLSGFQARFFGQFDLL